MINVSDEFRRAMASRRDFRCRARVTLSDGDIIELGDAELTAGGSSFTDGAGRDSLPLGEAVSRSAEIEIYSDGDRYADVDFFGAGAALSLVFALDDGREESIELGTFTVTGTETRGETVKLTMQDAMWRADTVYAPGIGFPATLGALFRDVCGKCGLPFSTSVFANSTFVVDKFPEGEYTCRELLGYIAMFAGGNARVDRAGRCGIVSYDFAAAPMHALSAWIELDADTNDAVVTGVRAGDQQTGEDGYVLTLSNPLFAGHEKTALDLVAERVVGAVLHRFDGEVPAYPTAEFMDTAEVTDRRGRTFQTVLTDVRFAFSGKTELACSAAPAAAPAGRYISPSSGVIAEARRLVADERTARETAVAELAGRLANASGLYITADPQPDGSGIYYMHNKPSLDESDIVWKLTSEAIAISTDGGKSYPYGFTVTGELIARLLYAEGIDADYINSGSIVARDGEGNVVFSVNVETGEVKISGDSVTVGGRSVADAVADAAETANTALEEARSSASLTVVLGNEYEGIPTDSDGNYSGALNASTTVQVYYGHTDVSDSCTYSCAASSGVTGRWSAASRTYTVTALSTDTGWVDITARYMSLFTVTKRFGVAKLRAGAQGASGTQGINLYRHGDREQVADRFIQILTYDILAGRVGEAVTVSFDCKINSGGTVRELEIYPYQTNGLSVAETYNFTPTKEYKRYTFHFTVKDHGVRDTSYTKGGIAIYDWGGANEYTIRNVKIELGTVAHPVWTPSPQDLTARMYMIEMSANVLKRGAGSAVTPSTLTAHAYFREGSDAVRSAYSGHWVVATSTDGTTFTNVSSATSAEGTSHSFAVGGLGSAIVAVRFTLYAAGGQTNALDMQTVPIITDASAMTHEQVFNLLTDGGRLQGIYKEGGQLYVNGAYIKAGTVSAGKLAAGAVSAGNIASGAVTADKLAAGSVTADKIGAGTITGDKIQGRTLQGYIIGGSWASGNIVTMLNNLGIVIAAPGVASGSGVKAWRIGISSTGALTATQGYYVQSSNRFYEYTNSGAVHTLASWSSVSGSSDRGGGGSGYYPVPFT